MKVLYFAWVRTKTGVAEESLPLPAGVETVGQFLAWLKDRGAGFSEALKAPGFIRVAVNQEFATDATRLKDGDEVALFPPVTGGRT
ncbi:MAG TPA: molybdopterin converting factor subunit 1 [Alphaproteobacteria bacterium]|nr:molybdopterin converting factor subunit 1 [Alphaproteobacteria bacterium]